MPSKSKPQHNLMAMVANGKKASKRLGIPQSVGKEYMKADKGKTYAKGGKASLGKLFKGKDTYGEELKEAKAIKSGNISPQQYAKGEKMEESKKPKVLAKGEKVKKLSVGGRSDGSGLPLSGNKYARMRPTTGNSLRRGPVSAAQQKIAQQKADAIAALQQKKGSDAQKKADVIAAVQQRTASMQQQAANITANQQAAAHNRAAAESRFQQMAANAPRPMVNAPVQAPAAPAGMKKGGCVKKSKGGCTKMARGGGVESRGKTKGRFI